MKKKFLFLLSLMLFIVPVQAQNGSAPYITCSIQWIQQDVNIPIDIGIAGYTDPGASIIQSTVNWGDNQANISTISNWSCPVANTTFATHWSHIYKSTGSFLIIMTLQDSANRITTIQYSITISPDPPSGGGGGQPSKIL